MFEGNKNGQIANMKTKIMIRAMKLIAKLLGLRPEFAAATYQWQRRGDRCNWGLACGNDGSNPRLWVKSDPKTASGNDSQLLVVSRKGVYMSNW